jgi:hypothetical protein
MRIPKDEFVRRIVNGLQRRDIERKEKERRARRFYTEGVQANKDHIAAASRRKHRSHINRRK